MRNSGAARDAAKFIGRARISQSFRSVSKRYAHNFEERSLTNSRQRLNASLRFYISNCEPKQLGRNFSTQAQIQLYRRPIQKMKSGSRRPLSTAIFFTIGFVMRLQAYGPDGHEIVGAIADERLANTPTAAKIRALIDGLSLEKAAVIADEIKGWDKKGADDPKAYHYFAHPKIDRQLRDF